MISFTVHCDGLIHRSTSDSDLRVHQQAIDSSGCDSMDEEKYVYKEKYVYIIVNSVQ